MWWWCRPRQIILYWRERFTNKSHSPFQNMDRDALICMLPFISGWKNGEEEKYVD
jgi:hypothetical protein